MLKILTSKVSMVVLALAILVGIYIGGSLILPNNIKASYESKDCKQVISLNTFYLSAYPAFLVNGTIHDLTKECLIYTSATEIDQKQNPDGAYQAYDAYRQAYPNGLFIKEADQQSALILMSQAQNYLTAKQYLKSIETVELVRRNYGTTSAASEADDLIPNIYITWAKDRRDSSDFTGAESTLKTFNAWATAEKQVNNAKLAQLELAHTYLAWGQSLQTEKKLEDAKAKFDLTIATDPEPEAQAGPAIQAKAANVKLYIDWGDSLVAKNDFTGAISHYETAISLADAKDQPAIKDHIADVHLKLADNLSGKEDFIGALKEIEHASAFAATADAKTNTETMQTKTYQAFSMSSGAQARAAILEAAKKICVKEQPELPIFGLDKQNIRAYLSIDPEAVNLADDILATTPASLHYIGCVIPSTKGEKLKTHLSKTVGGGSTVVSNSYVYVERATSYWDVRLYDIKTGKMVATQQFAGIPPIDWGAIWSYIDNNNVEGDITFAGPPPTLETISAWVEKYLK